MSQLDFRDVLVIVARPGCDGTSFEKFMDALQMRDRFLRGQATFQDFLDAAHTAGVPMDEFADDIAFNLAIRGVRV